MLRKIIAVFLILFLGAALASAQGGSRKARGAGKSHVFFGGGGYGLIRGRILLGGEGGGFTRDVASDTQKATLSGGYGFFNVGYVIFSKGDFKLFPLLGIGGGVLSLRIAQKTATPTFDEVLEANITTGGFLFNFALGLDYLLTLGEDEEGRPAFRDSSRLHLLPH